MPSVARALSVAPALLVDGPKLLLLLPRLVLGLAPGLLGLGLASLVVVITVFGLPDSVGWP